MAHTDNAHAFTAIRGVQGGREYYVAMVPLQVIPKIFLFDDADLPPDLRAQRTLNRARVPEIARYLVENPRNYIFSALTASIDGAVQFVPLDGAGPAKAVGRLIVPMTARLLINDGQHRRAAVEEALKERPELGDETLSVIFFADAGLKRSQQMFADLNRHVVRPPQSLAVLYDQRDPLAQLAYRLVARVDVFKHLTELEKTSVPSQANKLFTLSGIYQATKTLLAKSKKQTVTTSEEDLAATFWQEVGRVIPDWRLAADKRVSCVELRRDYVHAHGVTLSALGCAGATLLAQDRKTWKTRLRKLQRVDWSRSASLWEGRALVSGRVSKAHTQVILTTNLLKLRLGLTLSPEEQRIEREFSSRRSSRIAA
jgi:DNA sulfur modification protein DndB